MYSTGFYSEQIAFTVINTISVLVCLLAAVLVLVLKLHKKVVYRLALYQVLSALSFALLQALQITFINYDKNTRVYGQICVAVGWLVLYSQLVKLVFTLWVTFHLFCFAVLYKNLKKLEVLYVVTSLLVPALLAAVPLTTQTFGVRSSSGTLCFIYAQNDSNSNQHKRALIERFVLWDGPATVTLSVASIVMIATVLKLGHRICQHRRYESLTDTSGQHWKALKQLLPLAAFPILFFVFTIPVSVFHIFQAVATTPNERLVIANMIFVFLWSTTSGLTLIIHISVAKCCRKKAHVHAHVFNEVVHWEPYMHVYIFKLLHFEIILQELCRQCKARRK